MFELFVAGFVVLLLLLILTPHPDCAEDRCHSDVEFGSKYCSAHAFQHNAKKLQ